MRRRPVLAAALAAAVLLGPWSHAAEPAPQVTDPESDANYLNDNAPVSSPLFPDNPANNNPTPVGSNAGADITSIIYTSTTVKGVVKGFTVRMTLKAEPTKEAMLFRATGNTAECSTLWFQYYTVDPKNTPQASLRHTCDGTQVVPIPVNVAGNTITWNFEFSNANMPKAVRKGSEIVKLGGHSRPFVVNPACADVTKCTTNPLQADTTNNFAGPYKVGS